MFEASRSKFASDGQADAWSGAKQDYRAIGSCHGCRGGLKGPSVQDRSRSGRNDLVAMFDGIEVELSAVCCSCASVSPLYTPQQPLAHLSPYSILARPCSEHYKIVIKQLPKEA